MIDYLQTPELPTFHISGMKGANFVNIPVPADASLLFRGLSSAFRI